MSYWAEISRIAGTRRFKLHATIDSSDKLKPKPMYGGEDCLPITHEMYEILRLFGGDVIKAYEVVKHISATFETPLSFTKKLGYHRKPRKRKA